MNEKLDQKLRCCMKNAYKYNPQKTSEGKMILKSPEEKRVERKGTQEDRRRFHPRITIYHVLGGLVCELRSFRRNNAT